jgi:hypothetical protein
VAAVAHLYRGDTAAVGHGARAPDVVGYGARVPAALHHGGRNVTPRGRPADRWRHPYRCAPWRQKILPPWDLAVDVYFPKFFVRPFNFRKTKKKNIKKIDVSHDVRSPSVVPHSGRVLAPRPTTVASPLYKEVTAAAAGPSLPPSVL